MAVAVSRVGSTFAYRSLLCGSALCTTALLSLSTLIPKLFSSPRQGFRTRTQLNMSDEVDLAQKAEKGGGDTIFSKIVKKQLPADIIHEDELCLAFRDINPMAPVHFLIIPKKPIPSMDELTDADQKLLGHMMLTAKKVATQEKLRNGYRIVLNNGRDGAQSVFHLHLHIMGGRQLGWPPG